MKKLRIHIDQLFNQKFKHFQLPVENTEFSEIKDQLNTPSSKEQRLFEDFELPVSDEDWLITKNKLDLFLNQENKAPKDLNASELFGDFELQVTDSDWQSTKNKLQKNKRKKLVWWIWLNSFILLSIIGAGLYLYNTNGNLIKKETTNIVTNGTNEIQKNSKVENQSQNSIQNNSEVKSEKSENNFENNNSANEITKPSYSYKKQINNSLNIPTVGEVSSSKKGINNPQTQKNEKVQNPVSSIVNNNPNTSEDFELNAQNIYKILKPISTKGIQPLSDWALVNLPKILWVKDSTKMKNKFPIGLYVGTNSEIGISSRILPKTNNSKYNEIRNSADKPFLQMTNGLSVALATKKSQWQTGINFTQYSYSSKYDFKYTIYDTIPVKDPNGNIIGYFFINPREAKVNESHVTTFKQINIPLNYSRKFSLNNKHQLLLGIGTQINYTLSSNTTGYLSPYYLQTIQNNSIKYKTLNLSSQFQIGTQSLISKSLIIQPSISSQFYMNSIQAKENKVRELPFQYGINIKLLYLIK